MSPPMVFCPRHRQTALVTGPEATETVENGLCMKKAAGLLICPVLYIQCLGVPI